MQCAGSRLATGLTEIGLMSLTVSEIGVYFWISKLLVSAIVVITNYLISRSLVFRAAAESDMQRN
ncbi:MAG: GtrA family protein [Oscillospiraceae bacterium]|nr:GtrA family protein [Oscillospiraceae bacterium]